MKSIMRFVVALTFMMPAVSFAHSDQGHHTSSAQQYCHEDHATGEFHCHSK